MRDLFRDWEESPTLFNTARLSSAPSSKEKTPNQPSPLVKMRGQDQLVEDILTRRGKERTNCPGHSVIRESHVGGLSRNRSNVCRGGWKQSLWTVLTSGGLVLMLRPIYPGWMDALLSISLAYMLNGCFMRSAHGESSWHYKLGVTQTARFCQVARELKKKTFIQ